MWPFLCPQNFEEEEVAFDEEFTKLLAELLSLLQWTKYPVCRFICRLAEGRSNPNLLDIGFEHFEVVDDVKAFRGGEMSAADISQGRSHEDLLDL